MAVKDSGEIATNSNYTLGDYSFRIERTSVPGSTNDKVEAICTKDGKNARKSIQVPSSTQITGWYVEANETEATVYVSIKQETVPLDLINKSSSGGGVDPSGKSYTLSFRNGSGYMTHLVDFTGIFASGTSGTQLVETYPDRSIPHSLSSTATINDKTVYYLVTRPGPNHRSAYPVSPAGLSSYPPSEIAWAMIYGDSGGASDKIVGRFPIDVKDADGVGPGSDWTDPEDYDEDWEEGDPTHTLYVEVTGALSGRHNDPIVDPSYSYIPADKDTVKQYGCGGDGGHGGGGGAGASTVVVHKFATNQANSKEVTAIARRHGYGSGGGKGGKGGDGCILVYY